MGAKPPNGGLAAGGGAAEPAHRYVSAPSSGASAVGTCTRDERMPDATAMPSATSSRTSTTKTTRSPEAPTKPASTGLKARPIERRRRHDAEPGHVRVGGQQRAGHAVGRRHRDTDAEARHDDRARERRRATARRRSPCSASAVVAATVVMIAFGDQRAMNRDAVRWPSAAQTAISENSKPDTVATRSVCDAELLDEERQNRAEAAIDRLQREDHREREQESRRAGELAGRPSAGCGSPPSRAAACAAPGRRRRS